jgi:paraquat-inducible protein A
MWLVAMLVLFMAVIMPFAELAALAYLLVPLAYGRRAPGFTTVFRLLQFASRWGAVEVFVLGALVSLVKLGHVADVAPGIALVSYGALMLVIAAIEASFDPRELWARATPA